MNIDQNKNLEHLGIDVKKLKAGDSITIPLHEEKITINKRKKVVEYIVIKKEKYTVMEKIKVPVKREILKVREDLEEK